MRAGVRAAAGAGRGGGAEQQRRLRGGAQSRGEGARDQDGRSLLQGARSLRREPGGGAILQLCAVRRPLAADQRCLRDLLAWRDDLQHRRELHRHGRPGRPGGDRAGNARAGAALDGNPDLRRPGNDQGAGQGGEPLGQEAAALRRRVRSHGRGASGRGAGRPCRWRTFGGWARRRPPSCAGWA